MNIISLVERVIIKLGALPGLGFLQSYVTEFHGRKAGVQNRAALYKGYVSSVRGAGAEVAQAAGGSKPEAEEEEDEDYEDDDDDESYMQ